VEGGKGKDWKIGRLEGWKEGRMEDSVIERNRNINRGFRKLRVWQDAIEVYVFVSKLMKSKKNLSFKVKDQIEAAAISISSNISEGYCRRSINEYLQHLNIANGSSGEVYAQMYAVYKSGEISKEEFDRFDDLHYKTENQLLRLQAEIQDKRKKGEWEDSFVTK